MNPDFNNDYSSSEEEDVCPLCLEELDITDKNFKPCTCGYQVISSSLNRSKQHAHSHEQFLVPFVLEKFVSPLTRVLFGFIFSCPFISHPRCVDSVGIVFKKLWMEDVHTAENHMIPKTIHSSLLLPKSMYLQPNIYIYLVDRLIEYLYYLLPLPLQSTCYLLRVLSVDIF